MALPRQCRVCFQKNIPSSQFGSTICVDCEIIEGQKKLFKENERHHKEVEKNLNNQQNTQLNISKKNTLECPHCSTELQDYATVCYGCGAEKVGTEIPGIPFKWKRFFYFTLIIFCFLHYANIDQTNNGDYFDFYKKEDFLDIIWMFCVEIFIAPLIIASPIPYFFSRGKKSTISYSWYR